MREQMVIPGMECLMAPVPEPKAGLTVRKDLADLKDRVLGLELQLALLKIQFESQGHR